MPTRVSQRDRLNNALSAFRTRGPLVVEVHLHQLDAPKRSKFAKRLLDEAWTTKNFYRLRTTITPSWRGDELTVLHEMSYYLLPRAVWARRREGGESWVRREQVFTLVKLVQHKFGRDAAAALREELTRAGVKYRPRRMVSAAQRAELAKRSKFKKQVKVLDSALVKLGEMIRQPTTRATLATAMATKPGKRRIVLED